MLPVIEAFKAAHDLADVTEPWPATQAEKAVAGKVAVNRNRFVQLAGDTSSVNRELEARARGLAGLKGYTTNLVDAEAEFVINAHHQRESIDAHLTIVFAALAIARFVQAATS